MTTSTFGEYVDVILGGTPKTTEPKFWDGNIPWVSVTDFPHSKRIYKTEKYITEEGLNKSNTKLLKEGDLILSARGTVGKLVVVGRPVAFNQSCYALRSKDTSIVNQDFLYYFTKAKVYELQQKAVGGVFDTIIKSTIEQLAVQFPDITVQERIGEILSAYDDLIENNLGRIQLLEEAARCKYKLLMEENRDLLQEQVLGDVLDLSYGKALKSTERTPGTIPVYGSSGVVGTHTKSIVSGPGIIVGRKGNVGSIFWSQNDFYPIDTVYFVSSSLSYFFLYHNLKFDQHFDNSDAAVPGLNRTSALSNKVYLPPAEKVDAFEQVCKVYFDLRWNLQKQNERLREARDILLPGLISGEIDVAAIDVPGESITELREAV